MPTILHIEDDDASALVFRAAIDEAQLQVAVYRVSDGEAALAYLRGEGRHAGRAWPDLVFLDLNMPRLDGWEVLAAMRADGDLQSIPIVILTTSCRRSDKDRAHALGARHYITKPTAFGALVAAVESIYRSLVARD